MTAEGGNWTGWVVNEIVGRRLRSRTRATSTAGTGSTITIIIVGPMIGPAAAAVLAAADRGDDRDHDCLSFNDMCQSVRGALPGVEETAGGPFSRSSRSFRTCRS
jgi:hypothetical protein